MKCSILALAAAVVAPVFAAPAVVKRDNPTDVQILQYALTLEHLENAFYSGALKKFSAADFEKAGLSKDVHGRIQQIADHEASHVAFLTKALGDGATKPCTYKFPYKTVKDFTMLSSIIEGVGVSAYLGAAKYITNPDYLTAAGSILTTESRHQAYVKSMATDPKSTRNPWSGAYDAPLSLNEVYSLASGFIVKCPSTNPALPVKAFPTLAAAPGFAAGKSTTFTFDSTTPNLNVAFMGSNGIVFAPLKGKSADVPEGLEGTVYAVVTSASSGMVTDDTVVAGPAILDFGLKSSVRQN